ncbi:RNA polymerase subunit RPABC4/transcription elongation factor Spt4 [Paenibacillus favisporus]|uniref:RNA polymerase subunit RPABC4/transcription elongation factor Spt4 n=1 Tax=Paenibacillus favisporus TaxID=221028 RepID=A0ABV2F6U7_9BACL
MNIIQRLKEGANRATEKAQGTLEVSKLNSQIADIEREMGIHYREMGKVFYEGYRIGDMSKAEKEMVDLCKSCDLLQEEIDELRTRIAELKNERLCKCGYVATLDANFCPSCGRKLADDGVKPSEPAKPVGFAFDEEAIFGSKAQDEPSYREEPEEREYSGQQEAAAAVEQDYDYEFPMREAWDDLDLTDTDENDPEAERERRQAEELERERERQLELDRRIRYWKENSGDGDTGAREEGPRDSVKCQICRADLPKGSKWCPRCGAEQI